MVAGPGTGANGLRPALGTELGLEHQVGPALVMYAQLLSADGIELGETVARAVETNPALEVCEPVSCPGCGRPLWREPCLFCVASVALPNPRETDLADEHGVVDELLTEAVAELPELGRAVAAYLLADVDPRGILGRNPADVARAVGVEQSLVDDVITLLRGTLGPTFGARDVAESLVILLDGLPADLRPPVVVRQLLLHHLDLLATRGSAAVAAAMGVRVREVDEAWAFVREHLRPPVLELAAALPRPPVPDVVVRRRGELLEVEIVPGPWSLLEVSPAYRRLVAADGDHATAIRQQVHEAALLVDLVARRERTLLGIAEYVVEWQRERVLHGRAEHRALTRREVALGLGLHPSTVSRAVHHKHLQLPTGQVIALADLFGGSTGAVEALREILDHSGGRSDRELAALLAGRGFTVARRTVAKYRTLLRGSARRTS